MAGSQKSQSLSGWGFCQMFTTDGDLLARCHCAFNFTNPAKIAPQTQLIKEPKLGIAQNFGTRLWTSCTRLKTNKIKTRKKGGRGTATVNSELLVEENKRPVKGKSESRGVEQLFRLVASPESKLRSNTAYASIGVHRSARV